MQCADQRRKLCGTGAAPLLIVMPLRVNHNKLVFASGLGRPLVVCVCACLLFCSAGKSVYMCWHWDCGYACALITILLRIVCTSAALFAPPPPPPHPTTTHMSIQFRALERDAMCADFLLLFCPRPHPLLPSINKQRRDESIKDRALTARVRTH